MAGAASTLKVSRAGDAHVVHVGGRATLRESPAFYHFAEGLLEQPSACLIIDLSNCIYLDSTFLGSLIQLHKRFGSSPQGPLILAVPKNRRGQLFGWTKFDKLFHTLDAPPETSGASQDLMVLTPSQRALGQHVMQCHQRLAELNGPHQAVYRSIADQLARELEQ